MPELPRMLATLPLATTESRHRPQASAPYLSCVGLCVPVSLTPDKTNAPCYVFLLEFTCTNGCCEERAGWWSVVEAGVECVNEYVVWWRVAGLYGVWNEVEGVCGALVEG